MVWNSRERNCREPDCSENHTAGFVFSFSAMQRHNPGWKIIKEQKIQFGRHREKLDTRARSPIET
jgi:hypothetical protein